MEMIRIVGVAMIMSALCFHLIKEIVLGFRSGTLRYGRGRGERIVRKNQQPLRFWLLMGFFSLLAVASVGMMA